MSTLSLSQFEIFSLFTYRMYSFMCIYHIEQLHDELTCVSSDDLSFTGVSWGSHTCSKDSRRVTWLDKSVKMGDMREVQTDWCSLRGWRATFEKSYQSHFDCSTFVCLFFV